MIPVPAEAEKNIRNAVEGEMGRTMKVEDQHTDVLQNIEIRKLPDAWLSLKGTTIHSLWSPRTF
jgi:hypothetical protein